MRRAPRRLTCIAVIEAIKVCEGTQKLAWISPSIRRHFGSVSWYSDCCSVLLPAAVRSEGIMVAKILSAIFTRDVSLMQYGGGRNMPPEEGSSPLIISGMAMHEQQILFDPVCVQR